MIIAFAAGVVVNLKKHRVDHYLIGRKLSAIEDLSHDDSFIHESFIEISVHSFLLFQVNAVSAVTDHVTRIRANQLFTQKSCR